MSKIDSIPIGTFFTGIIIQMLVSRNNPRLVSKSVLSIIFTIMLLGIGMYIFFNLPLQKSEVNKNE